MTATTAKQLTHPGSTTIGAVIRRYACGIDADEFDAGEPPPDRSAPTSPEAAMSTPASVGRRRFALRRAADRLPTKWLGTIGAAVFVVLTAAFGGADKAPPPALPLIAPGEANVSDQVSITVEQLVVAEAVDVVFTETAGDKVAVLVVTATNNWDRPLTASESVVRNLSVSDQSVPNLATEDEAPVTGPAATTTPAGANDPSGTDTSVDSSADGVLDAGDLPSVRRLDDLGLAGELQPAVPVRLALIWTVEPDFARRIAASEEMFVTIYDQELIVSEYTRTDTGWNFPSAAATVVLKPTARGSIGLAELDGTRTANPADHTLDTDQPPPAATTATAPTVATSEVNR